MFANIFQRETIEAVYPRDVFESDAGQNSTADTVILQPTGDEPDPVGFVRFVAEQVRPLVP